MPAAEGSRPFRLRPDPTEGSAQAIGDQRTLKQEAQAALACDGRSINDEPCAHEPHASDLLSWIFLN
jgi:hypothetical protein